MRIVYSAVVIVAIIGFVSLIPGMRDAAIYYYWRIANGSTIEIDTECYIVPSGWSIHSLEEYNDSKLAVIQTNINGQYIFASIGNARIVVPENIDNSLSDFDTQRVFELNNLSNDNHARYWTYTLNRKLVVLSESKEIVLKLSEDIHHCET